MRVIGRFSKLLQSLQRRHPERLLVPTDEPSLDKPIVCNVWRQAKHVEVLSVCSGRSRASNVQVCVCVKEIEHKTTQCRQRAVCEEQVWIIVVVGSDVVGAVGLFVRVVKENNGRCESECSVLERQVFLLALRDLHCRPRVQ